MNIFEYLLYGLVAGFAEFMPVSAQGHKGLLRQILGLPEKLPLLELMIHIGVLLSLFIACKPAIARLQHENQLMRRSASRRSHRQEGRGIYELRLLRSATVPMLLGMLLLFATEDMWKNLMYLSAFLLINGVIIFVPEYMRQGNKDARSMSGLDSLLMGLFSALSVFPGISRVAVTLSFAVARGAQRQRAYQWVLLLSIPALILLVLLDVIGLFTVGIGLFSFGILVYYLLAGFAAFAGGYLAITLMRFLTVRTGFTGFAYYCWGAALFTFILYLIA